MLSRVRAWPHRNGRGAAAVVPEHVGIAAMAFPDNNDPFRKTSNTRRFSRTTVWAVAGAVVLVLFGILFIIPGRNMRE